MFFRIQLTARTTEGPGTVLSDPIEGWDDTSASIEGMVAGVGVENVIEIRIKRMMGV